LCDPDIVGAGIENTTGMVVSNNDRCGTFSERIREDLSLAGVSKTISTSIQKIKAGYTISFTVTN